MSNDIVKQARGWIGTPYQHQQSVRGAGCDCLGLLRGLWRDIYGAEPQPVPAYSRDWSEPQGEELLLRAALTHLKVKDVEWVSPGDVLLFRMRSGAVAKHLGIQAEIGEAPSFIHAYSGHGVVESSFSFPWKLRLFARFEFPSEVR